MPVTMKLTHYPDRIAVDRERARSNRNKSCPGLDLETLAREPSRRYILIFEQNRIPGKVHENSEIIHVA